MLIDIVDENDLVIGQEEENKVHELKQWHRAAEVLMCKDDSCSEVLLIQTKNMLMLPGGHLKTGETYLQGMLRIVHEKMLVGRSLPNVEIVPLFKIKDEATKEIKIVFRIIYPGPFNPNPQEVQTCIFHALNVVLKEIKVEPHRFASSTLETLKEYASRFKRVPSKATI